MPLPSEGSTFCTLQHAASFRRIDLLHAATCRFLPKDRPSARCNIPLPSEISAFCSCNMPLPSEGSTFCTLQHLQFSERSTFCTLQHLQFSERSTFCTLQDLQFSEGSTFCTRQKAEISEGAAFFALHGPPSFRRNGLLHVAPSPFVPNDSLSARAARGPNFRVILLRATEKGRASAASIDFPWQ
jgi:hypothetical protein